MFQFDPMLEIAASFNHLRHSVVSFFQTQPSRMVIKRAGPLRRPGREFSVITVNLLAGIYSFDREV